MPEDIKSETPSPSAEPSLGSEPIEELNLPVIEKDAIEKDAVTNSGDSVRVAPLDGKDLTRQTITLWLIGLLCAIVALTFVALLARGAASGFRDQQFFHELKQVLDVLLGPVITLLASAIGFYFGYKQGELIEQVKKSR